MLEVLSTAAVVVMCGLAIVKYRVERGSRSRPMPRPPTDRGDLDAGIEFTRPELDAADLREVLLGSGHVITVVNIWNSNWGELERVLTQALAEDETQTLCLQLFLQHPDAARGRPAELRPRIDGQLRDVRQDILYNLSEIFRFADHLQLGPERLRVALYRESAVFMIHARGDDALVGFFWRRQLATTGTQLRTTNHTGHFAEGVWKYLDHVQDEAVDVTRDELERWQAPGEGPPPMASGAIPRSAERDEADL